MLERGAVPITYDLITLMSEGHHLGARTAKACTVIYRTAHIYQRVDCYVGAYM